MHHRGNLINNNERQKISVIKKNISRYLEPTKVKDLSCIPMSKHQLLSYLRYSSKNLILPETVLNLLLAN
jgi:hypothetical protein